MEVFRFRYCPSCGAETIAWNGLNRYDCSLCGFCYYQNTAAAVIGILVFEGQVAFVRRNRDPFAGWLDLPGGFTDPGESAEQAMRREALEELGIELGELDFLCSQPNIYPYKRSLYNTCDMVFIADIKECPKIADAEEISELLFFPPAEFPMEDVAFSSVKMALEAYLDYLKR
jgi:NAD+ diphosphatase